MEEFDDELMYRYLQGQTSAEENERIQSAIDSQEDTKKSVKEIETLLFLNDMYNQCEKYDNKKAYKKVSGRIDSKERFHTIYGNFRNIAAILLLPLVLSCCYLYFYRNNTTQSMAWTEITSIPGVISKVILPDSSVVWLNSKTSIKYPTEFVKNRQVLLDGEGYFEVKSSKSNPFWVKTDKGYMVKSYGTGFNVRAYKEDMDLNVYLSHGAIDLSATSSQKHYKMKKGELLSVNCLSGEIVASSKNDLEIISWKEGKMYFRNTPLREIIRQLSRRYNVLIEVEEEDIKEYKYTATFTTESLEQVLNLLKLTAPLEWELIKGIQKKNMSYTQSLVKIRKVK